ncbi:S-layer homology domain-containing protein [Paenibacillus sp. HJGM_3]|uniref:S-layer homology domain-containing protein n=1 Tax=Paenibacillus sp. HJGM_3 TaxID=3379816 RepID=UPI00385AC1DB
MKKTILITIIASSTLFGGIAGATATSVFSDSGWWTPAAEWANKHNLMTGMGDGSFGGDKYVTRGQLAQVLKNMADAGIITINNTSTPTPSPTPTPTPTPSPVPVQGKVLVDTPNVKVTFTGMTSEGYPTFTIQNKTGKAVTVQIDNMAINGISSDILLMSETVAPNSTARNVEATTEDFKDIRTADTMTGKFLVLDPDTFDRIETPTF